MGTSEASKGPNPGVSFDPPWLNDEGGFEPTDLPPPAESNNNGEAISGEDPLLAPPARFRNARTWIGKYARESSGRTGFQKAAGHYSKTGMGGSGKLANRMRYSTATGARLAQFLGSTASQNDSTVNTWVNDIVERGLSGQTLIDAIIQQVAPSSGSRDEESCADSMAEALGEFLENHENENLLELDTGEIREITESFIANEACNRMTNDIGQIFERENVSLKESLSLLTEMREFLREDLSVQIESLWKVTANPTQPQLDQILRSSIERTFRVYEGEL